MVLLDSVLEQATQMLLNHAELPMIKWNINISLRFFHISASSLWIWKWMLKFFPTQAAHSYFGQIATFSLHGLNFISFVQYINTCKAKQ